MSPQPNTTILTFEPVIELASDDGFSTRLSLHELPEEPARDAQHRLTIGKLLDGSDIAEDMTCGLEGTGDGNPTFGYTFEGPSRFGFPCYRVTLAAFDCAEEGIDNLCEILDGDLTADTYAGGDHQLVAPFWYQGHLCEAHLYFVRK